MGRKSLRKEQYRIMVTLKVMIKGETGYKWNKITLVDITDSRIEVRRWAGI